MPEVITLADGFLAVKGRNLLKQSCPLVVGNWINNGGSPAIDNTGQKPAVPVNIAWIKLEYGDELTGPSAAPEDEEAV